MLKPWKREQFCIPPEKNAEFVCAMEDTLTVYARPRDEKRPLVCMDETSRQLIKETRLPIAHGPGKPALFDHEYERNGTANLFMLFEPLSGRRHVRVTERRTRADWAYLVKELCDVIHPSAEKIVLVMDNLNTHSGASLYEAFPPEEARRLLDRLEIHYTPKHGSWLNMAEIELRVLSGQCLSRRIADRETLAREVAAWEKRRNETAAPVDWRFTTKDARIKLKRLYPTIQP